MAPTNRIEKNYFAWLGWVLIIATIVATGAAILLRRRSLAAVVLIAMTSGVHDDQRLSMGS